MTTRFRVTYTCDDRTSPDCLGEFVFESTLLPRIDWGGSEAFRLGWLHGYGPEDSYDVCPACRETEGAADRFRARERPEGRT